MPRLSPDGRVGMGTGGIQGSIDLHLINDAYGPMFVNGHTAVFQQISDGKLNTLDITTGIRTPVSAHGANDLAAGGDNWAAWLDHFGLYSKNGFNSVTAGLLDVGPDGTVGYIPNRQIGYPARANRGSDDWLISEGIVYDLQLLGDDRAIWVDQFRNILTKGLPLCKQVGRAYRPRAVQFNGEWWVCYWSDIKGVILHPFLSLEGYVVVSLDFNAFQHSTMIFNSVFRTVWSDRAGEIPSDFRELYIDPAQPRVPLETAEPIEVIGRKLYSGWIEHSEPPPNLVPTYANNLMRTYDAGSIRLVGSEQFIGRWIQGSTVEEIEAQCQSRNEPCFAYWDSRSWPRWPNLKPNDILGLQAYCLKEETPHIFEMNQQAVIDSVPAHYNLGLVPQCYTSNEHLTTNLAGLVPVYSRLVKKNTRINHLLMFSDTRPTGLQDHPEVLPLWQEFHAGIIGVPGMADNGIENGILVRPRDYHFSITQGMVLDGTDATLRAHLEILKPQWYKFGFGIQHNSTCESRPRNYFPTAVCPNAAPNLANPNEVCLGVKQDPMCWEEHGRFANLTNHPPTQWIWEEHGGPAYQPITPVTPPNPGSMTILVFGFTNPTRRSDPLGCHIAFEVASDRPVSRIQIDLVGSGMEPKITDYPVFPGNDGRFWRGANVKLTHEGTWDLKISAVDDAGNTASAIAGRVTVIP